MRFTTLPFLIAFMAGLLVLAPTNVYAINAWNHGTEKVEPWHAKLSTLPVVQHVVALASRVREWCSECASVPLVVSEVGEAALGLLVPGASQLKACRQRDAELRGEIARATKEKAAIGETAVREKRALTDAERAKFLAATPVIDALQAQLAENGELLAAAEASNEAERAYQGVKPDADTEASRTSAGRAGLVVGEAAEDKARKAPGFFGRCLQSVRKIAIHEDSAEDHKLVRMMAGPTGANTDVPSEGGFLVMPERSSSIVQRMYDTGAIASQVFRLPVGPGSNGITLPAIDETSRADGSRFGGVASGWAGQGVTTTAGKPKFRLMELKLRKILAFVYGTDELIADAQAFEAWVTKNLPLELTFRTEDAFINGDGSNKPIGILNSGAAVTVTRNTASRVFYEDVSGMWKRMWAPLRSTAVWLVDQSVEQELEQLSIAIGTAGVLAPIYRPAGVSIGPTGTQGYSPATLYGRPILTTEYGANLGTVGDIILTNLGEYTAIDKGGVQQDVSLHVAFLTDEAVWRFSYRVDGQLNWNAALTPKSGGSTLSPVVTLT